MPVPEEYVGVEYRQNALTLKIYTDDKPSERRVSERPRTYPEEAPGPNNPFLDSDEAPTLVSFRATDQVDVPGLLHTGAIAVYPPEEAPAEEDAEPESETTPEAAPEAEAEPDAEAEPEAAEEPAAPAEGGTPS